VEGDREECEQCDGTGRIAVDIEVHVPEHGKGAGSYPAWDTCEACSGMGHLAPEVEPVSHAKAIALLKWHANELDNLSAPRWDVVTKEAAEANKAEAIEICRAISALATPATEPAAPGYVLTEQQRIDVTAAAFYIAAKDDETATLTEESAERIITTLTDLAAASTAQPAQQEGRGKP
jgi:hypothetical protein